MTFLRFPEEILGLVISSVQDHEDIFTLSLVSRLCYRFTFPLIYHTITFRKTTRVAEFIDLVKREADDVRPRISRAVRCLIFHQDLGHATGTPKLEEELILELENIVPQLCKLQHLIWDVADSFENPTIFEEFRRWCPQLRSVDLRARGDILDQSQCLFPWRVCSF